MNKAVCEIIHLIWVNILSEFMMINGNTMNTTVHNNDFQHLIKNIINILYTQTSSTTLKKFNETNLSKAWEETRWDLETSSL